MVRTFRDLLRRSPEGEVEAEVEPAPERCLSCDANLEGSRAYERYRVCHSCGFHFHLTARERIATLLDAGSFHEDDRGVTSIDPISFTDRHGYRSRVINAQRRTGLAEAALTGTGEIHGKDVVVAVLDFSFLGGSIGVVAGERLARAFEKAAARRVPLISVCSTSGTRMQEGLLALMQLPRIAVAAQALEKERVPHIVILTDPTTGSAYAGFVNQADFIIAEPRALVGFAAMRVVQEEQGAELPKGAHTAEAQAAHGLIDAVIDRPQLRDSVGSMLELLQSEYRLRAAKRMTPGAHRPHSEDAWRQVQLSRHSMRPTARDLIGHMATAFVEIHGDRAGDDDPGIVAGIASLGGEAVMVVGQERPAGENGQKGWIGPAGFRKAERAMRLAAKFDLPMITLLDTSGANPGLDSEEGGLGHAISSCMNAMLRLPQPTVAVIIGEASSEAAVAMAVADRVLMLDNAVYEVIRPEDAAKILYQEVERADEVAERLRVTAHQCQRLGVVDAIISEPGEGAHTDHAEAAMLTRRGILRALTDLERSRPKRRLQERYRRYREIGSTRSWVRGTVERRLAHLLDRIGGGVDRLRSRSAVVRRRVEFGDETDIPV